MVWVFSVALKKDVGLKYSKRLMVYFRATAILNTWDDSPLTRLAQDSRKVVSFNVNFLSGHILEL